MAEILVVVDMQNDFVSGVLGTQEAFDIVPQVVGRVVDGLNRGETVLFTRDTHGPEYPETQEGKNLPVSHCVKGTWGWELEPHIEALRGSAPIDKPAFGSVSLAEALRDRERCGGLEEIVLVGLCTDICVISNAVLLKAFLPETRITVDAACCAGVTPESHRTALEAMRACQIRVEEAEC